MGSLKAGRALLSVSLGACLLLAAACGGSSGSGASAGTAGMTGSGTGGTPGGGTGGGAGGDIGATPVAQCNSLVTLLCTRLTATCMVAGVNNGTQAACEKEINVLFGCDRAAGSLATCVADVRGLSCASLLPASGGLGLPASCVDVLQKIPASDAQQKCEDLVTTFCTQQVACLSRPDLLDQCVTANDNDCGLAVSVSATYAQCNMDVAKAPCRSAPADGGADGGATDGGSAEVPPIASCQGVLTFVQ